MKKFLPNLTLVFFSLALGFLVLEAVMRFLGYPGAIYDYDHETGLGILIPDNDFNYAKDCLKVRVTTNSAGFRDVEFAKKKPEDVYRIAVIGDSFVQALEVPLEKTFAKLLEQRLGAGEGFSGRKVEVYSFGRSGNGSVLNYLYLKRIVSAYHPDLVIHAFYPLNDPRDDSMALTDKYVRQTGDQDVRLGKVYPTFSETGELDAARLETDLDAWYRTRPPRSLPAKFARHSSFITWLKERYKAAVYNWKNSSPKGKRDASGEKEIPVDQEVFLKRQSPDWDAAWVLEEKLIGAIAAQARTIGAEYLLVSIADGFRVEGEYKTLSYWEPDAMDLKAPEKRLAAIAARTNVRYLNLMPVFMRNSAVSNHERVTFSCDGHWNETGHDWAAQKIADKLEAGLTDAP